MLAFLFCCLWLACNAQIVCESPYTCYVDYSRGQDIVWVMPPVVYGSPTCATACGAALFNNTEEYSCSLDMPIITSADEFSDIAAAFGFTCKVGRCSTFGWPDKVVVDQVSDAEGRRGCYFPTAANTFSCSAVMNNANCYGARFTTICPCVPPLSVYAFLSADYLQIQVRINSVSKFRLLDTQCAAVFDATTSALLGSQSICSWTEGSKFVIISLSSSSSIQVTDTLVIQSGALEFLEGSTWTVFNEPIAISYIEADSPETAPIINFEPATQIGVCDDLEPATQIGVCDDLELDIRGVIIANLGGRNAKSMEWRISLNDYSQNLTVSDTKYVHIPSQDMEPGRYIHFTLTVKSWYNRSSTINGTILKSNNLVPSAQLFYPLIFDADTTAITIESAVSFKTSCINATSSSSSLLVYSWDVEFVSMTPGAGRFNQTMFDALTILVNSTDGGGLTIENDGNYLQAGGSYAFTLCAGCNPLSGYNCSSVSSQAFIEYQYLPIVCQIAGGSKTLTLSISEAKTLSLILDALKWTYDPAGNELVFAWSCSHESSGSTVDCSDLFSSVNSSITSVSFNETFAANTEHLYTFSVAVFDANISSRAVCSDSITVDLTTTQDVVSPCYSSNCVRNFRLGVQVCDGAVGANTGSVGYTPYLFDIADGSAASGFSVWTADSDYYGPDGLRIALEETAVSETRETIDFRFCIQVNGGYRTATPDPAGDGNITCTPWASAGGGWSDLSRKPDAQWYVDLLRISIETREAESLYITDIQTAIQVEKTGVLGTEQYSSQISTGGAFSDWSFLYPFITAARVYLGITGPSFVAPTYVVSISTTSSSISIAEKLRLIASIKFLNGTKLSRRELLYNWTTTNDLLTPSQISQLRLNKENALNLVLDGSGLQMGANYEFVLNVYHPSYPNISLGVSSIFIGIKTEPVIFENGFELDPSSCDHAFEWLLDSFFYTFKMFVSADASQKPMSYAFGANIDGAPYYLHSSVLYQPGLFAALLPIECELKLWTKVTDYSGTQISDSLGCCLSVTNNNTENDCFSYKSDVVDAYFSTYNADNLFSNAQIYHYVFQSSFNLLHYLPNLGDTDCKYNHFKETIDVLALYFNSTNNALCDASKSMYVIQLSQTLTEWLLVGLENGNFFETLFAENCAYFDVVYDLLTQAFDPCATVRDSVLYTDELNVSPDSVLTNKVVVLYSNQDITDNLSILLTNLHHLPLVYELLNFYVEALAVFMEFDCSLSTAKTFVLLNRVLYISGLSSISTTIASESSNTTLDNFQIYTVREDEISDVSITVNDIDITLTKTGNNNDDEDDEGGTFDDLVVYGISSKPQSNTPYIVCSDHDEYVDSNGTLGNDSVSVTNVNRNTSDSDQPAINITMRFPYDPDMYADGDNSDTSSICVYWNEKIESWDTSGCSAQIDEEANTVICTCAHLTTFATLSALQRDKEECDSLRLQLGQSPYYSYVLLAFAGLFLVPFFWIWFNALRVKRNHQYGFCDMLKRQPMQVLFLVGMVCILQSITCLVWLAFINGSDSDAAVSSYALLIILMVPMILYYAMFVLIVTTWIDVTYSMGTSGGVNRFKQALKISIFVVAFIYLLLIVLLAAFEGNADRINVQIGAASWALIILISIVLITFYGYRVIKKLDTSIEHARKHTDVSRSESALKRVTVAVVAINIFLVFQCVMTTYFAFDAEAATVEWRTADLCMTLVFVFMVWYLYSRAFAAMVSELVGMSMSRQVNSSKGSGKHRSTSPRWGTSEKSQSGTSKDSIAMTDLPQSSPTAEKSSNFSP